jgi:ATP-dependent RNA helicase DeaD
MENEVKMDTLTKFKELGLSETTLRALKKKGFEEPTPIQEKVIPILLAQDTDIIGQAQTGTGKTAAFGLPLIEKIEKRPKGVKAIILVPTRELAIQVSEELNSLKGRKSIDIVPIYGGQSIELQLRRLRSGVDIVVGTPGRIIDHLNRKSLKLDKISYFVLDEADEMLNMGFIDDIEDILKNTNDDKRILLFSATMPDRIRDLAKKYMKDYKVVKITKKQLATTLADQIYFEVNERDKFEALCRIIDVEKDFYGLIFCRTKVDVENLANKLIDRGYQADALHGDISQYQRERIMRKFKSRRTNMVVATDVAARGIDIQNLTHVINYDLPQNPEYYVHRIGRTGRAGKEGTAITFVTPEEYRKLIYIKRITKSEIRKEEIPKVSQIIDIKKNRIKQEIFSIIEDENNELYNDFAKELLQDHSPEEVIAALLKYSFKSDLDENSYNKIHRVSIDNKGTTRLFVALGRSDDITPKKLVAMIKEEINIKDRLIKDIKIFDNFSFVTLPFEEAEVLLKVFKKKRGRRPIIEKAREKRKDNENKRDRR